MENLAVDNWHDLKLTITNFWAMGGVVSHGQTLTCMGLATRDYGWGAIMDSRQSRHAGTNTTTTPVCTTMNISHGFLIAAAVYTFHTSPAQA